MTELRAQLQQSAEAMQAMQGQLAQQQQQIQSLTNLQQQQQQQQQSQSASSSSAPSGVFGLLPLVDTRGLGKPEVFRGEAASFNDWNFVLRSYLGALDKRFQTLLARCGSSELPLWNRGLSPEVQGLSTQLYYKGREAYRQLYLEYNPRLKTRYVGLLLEILRCKFEGDLVTCIEAFERKVREYEKQSGKDIDDETIIGIVILGVTDASVKEHLVRHSGRLDKWSKMREEILEIARTEKYLKSAPTPMDVGATPQGGKKGKEGKGKGKDGKGKEGKGKKGEKGGGKTSSAPAKKGPCFYCQKPGHTKAECRKRLADLKKAEGKGRTAAAAPEAPEPEGESVAASTFCVAAPAADVGSCKHKLLVDTGAGGGLAPKGFDCEGVSVADSLVSMRTVTGEPLKLGRKLCSTMSSGDVGVKFHYRESEDVKFPVISMSEASDKGTWLVIGPKVQYLLCDKEGRKLNKVLEELPKTPLLKEKGVYWLEAQGHEVQYPNNCQ